jgi:hypothetical protein
VEVLWHFHPFQAKIDESLGNDFDSFTKSLEDSGKVITFAGRIVKRNYEVTPQQGIKKLFP